MQDESTPHFRELPNGHVNWLVPPSVQIALTGVKWAKQNKRGAITLTYTDGHTETRYSGMDMCREFSGIVGVIDFVQAGRSA